MELMDALCARRSVRGYTDAPVAKETLEALMAAAVQAPTGMNAQPWAFGVIQGAEKLKEYSDKTKAYLLAHAEDFPMLARYRDFFANPDSNIFHGATAMIVVMATPGGATADADCTMAAQDIMLAAVDKGLGTCWIGFFAIVANTPEMRDELGIPADYKVIAPIIIGQPKTDGTKPERKAPEVVFWKG